MKTKLLQFKFLIYAFAIVLVTALGLSYVYNVVLASDINEDFEGCGVGSDVDDCAGWHFDDNGGMHDIWTSCDQPMKISNTNDGWNGGHGNFASSTYTMTNKCFAASHDLTRTGDIQLCMDVRQHFGNGYFSLDTSTSTIANIMISDMDQDGESDVYLATSTQYSGELIGSIHDDTWYNLCMQVDISANQVRLCNNGTCSEFFPIKKTGWILDQFSIVSYDFNFFAWTAFDNITFVEDANLLSVTQSDKIQIATPVEGQTYALSQLSDWHIYTHLNSSDFDGDANILIVHYHGSDGLTKSDLSIMPSSAYSTDLMLNVIERGYSLPDGEAYALALLYKLDDCVTVPVGGNGFVDDFAEVENSGCTFYELGDDDVNFIVSASSGVSFIDSPLAGYKPPNTVDYATNTSDISSTTEMIDRLMNIFPISLIRQFRQIRDNIASSTYTEINVTLSDLMDDEAAAMIGGGANGIVLNHTLLEDNLPIWNTKIYPFMETLIYIIGFIIIMLIVFPSMKEIFGLFGSKKQSDTPERTRYANKSEVPVINLRR